MSLLAQRFRATVSKSKDKAMSMEAKGNVCYPTGFITFDFLNGYLVHVKNEEKGLDYKYFNTGIINGSLNLIIGRSHSGKSSWSMQVGYNIVRRFKTSAFFHDDIEGGLNDARKAALAGVSMEELKDKYICRDSGISTENFYDRIKMIYDEKLNNYDEYSYDTNLLDEMGNPLIALEPTVYMLDSFAMLMPQTQTTTDELPNTMGAPGIARQNTAMLRRIIPMCKAANIILLIINHILPEISLMPKKGSIRYLKPNERIAGGESIILLATNTIRFDDSKLKEKDGLGFEGAFVDISLVKSRQNVSGKAVPLVFNPEIGFDPDLSLLTLLKSNGKINGSGIGLYIGDRNDIKFSQKKFRDKLNSDSEFQEIVMEAVMDVLKSFVSDNESNKILNRNDKFSDNLLSKMNNMMKVA